jgi:hypothetical protein
MKVCSVNLADGIRVASDQIVRDTLNNLALRLNKLCIQLDTPNEEFYHLFAQLKSVGITKTPQEKITVEPGGVIGDRHFGPPDVRSIDGKFYDVMPFNQISFLSKERYDDLNKFYNKNIQAGEFGENIQTQGLIPHQLSHGTVLQFGSTAQVKICHLRRCCYKFVMVLQTADEYFDYKRNPAAPTINRIGVTGQVIKSGIIRPNDSIHVIYTPPTPVQLRPLNPEVDGLYSLTPCDPPTNT